MKKVIIYLMLISLTSCEKKESIKESIYIIDDDVEKLIEEFIESVPTSELYNGKKVITVGSWFSPEINKYSVSLRNYVPEDCGNIIGAKQLENGFKIYFVVIGEIPPFLKTGRAFKCDIPRRPKLPPKPIEYIETFFCYEKDEPKVGDCEIKPN